MVFLRKLHRHSVNHGATRESHAASLSAGVQGSHFRDAAVGNRSLASSARASCAKRLALAVAAFIPAATCSIVSGPRYRVSARAAVINEVYRRRETW